METTLNEYQRKAMSTCMDSCDNFAYMFIGMVGEVGEVASKVAKLIRKEKATIKFNDLVVDSNHCDLPDSEKLAIIDECGDCLWFIAGLTKTLGFTLEEVAERNLAKLADRKKRGVIDGNGDHR